MPGEHLVDWSSASVVATAALGLLALAYARAWWALRRAWPERVCVGQLVAFLSGSVAFWVGWSTRLAVLTHALLIAHMVQHLLFVLAAAPLMLLGAPLLVFGNGLGRAAPDQPRVPGPAWARRTGHRLTHPVVAGSLMVGVTIAWHVPVIFALPMHSPAWHAFENLTFFASGALFWWPVILPWPSRPHWPRWAIPLYLLGSDMPVSVLSAYLAFCGHVVYPAYLKAPRPYPITPLDDQVAAAMLMWVGMMIVFLAAAAVLVVRLLEPAAREER
jgi:putative membrane protein